MKTRNALAALVVGMALVGMIGGSAASAAERSWLATGTITKIDGSVFYLLGKDNVIYTVNAGKAEVVFEGLTSDCCSLQTGDTVRVFGTRQGPAEVRASRIRVLEREGGGQGEVAATQPGKEVKIIIEKQPETPVPGGAGPSEEQPPLLPGWTGQGLITDINYTGWQVKIQTSSGHYTIDVSRAVIMNGPTLIGLGSLNPGDMVRVTGDLSGFYRVAAQQVSVLRTRDEAQGAVSLTPVSMVGVIQQVDYPSFTFRMQGEVHNVVVACDADTVIQQEKSRMAFGDIRPGMRVKMTGYGSPATGYAAQHIMIIGVAP